MVTTNTDNKIFVMINIGLLFSREIKKYNINGTKSKAS